MKILKECHILRIRSVIQNKVACLNRENLNGVLAKLAHSDLPFALIIHRSKFRTENRTF